MHKVNGTRAPTQQRTATVPRGTFNGGYKLAAMASWVKGGTGKMHEASALAPPHSSEPPPSSGAPATAAASPL